MTHWRALVDHISLAGVVAQTPRVQNIVGGMLIAAASSLATTYIALPVAIGKLEGRVDSLQMRLGDVVTAQSAHEQDDMKQHERDAVCESRIGALESRMSEIMYNLRRWQAK